MEDKKDLKINDDTCKLYIGGIIPSWTGDRIKEILEKESGCDVMRVDVVKNFAFAFVTSKDIGEKIIEKVHGKIIEESRIVIQVSKNKQNLPDSEDLCFECGKPGHWAKECAKRRARMASRRTYDDAGSYPPYGRGGPPSGRERDPYYDDRRYAPPPHVSREREPYPPRYEPYPPRDPYYRDSREPYYRDPYARDPYALTTVSRYTYEYGRYAAPDPYAPRSATASRDSLYAVERERVAYGASAYPPAPVPRGYEPAPSSAAVVKADVSDREPYRRPADPYAPRQPADPYAPRQPADPYPRRSVDPYGPRRPADPYEPIQRTDPYAPPSATRSAYPSAYTADPLARGDPYDRDRVSDRYASDPAPKRFPEPAYAPRAK